MAGENLFSEYFETICFLVIIALIEVGQSQEPVTFLRVRGGVGVEQ